MAITSEILRFVDFEKRVALEHVSYIDAYIPSTRTVIEQKVLMLISINQ